MSSTSESAPAALHGALILDKPQGVTSFAAMRRAFRLLGLKTAGHAGTLDPMATGVLVVLLGEARKLSNWVMDHDKVYEAELTLGVETDTLDAEGQVTHTLDVPSHALDRDTIEAAFAPFLGQVMQIPPRFSALKRDGRTLMSMARAGEEFEVEARPALCHSLELLSIEERPVPKLRIRVHCGKGYYVRSFARDLGRALGTVAHLSGLRRERVGAFDLSQAVVPDDAPSARILPLPEVVPDLPILQVSGKALVDLRCGRTTFVPLDALVRGKITDLSDALVLEASHDSLDTKAFDPYAAPVALVATEQLATPRQLSRVQPGFQLKVRRGFNLAS